MVVVIFSFCSSLYVYDVLSHVSASQVWPKLLALQVWVYSYEYETHLHLTHALNAKVPIVRIHSHIEYVCVWSRRVACVVVHICVCTSIITTTKSSKFICILHKYVCMFEILSSFYRRSRIRRVDQSLAMFVVCVCATMTHDIFSSTFCLHKNAF